MALRAPAALVLLVLLAAPVLAGEEPSYRVSLDAFVQDESLSDDAHGVAFAILGRVRAAREGVFRLEAAQAVIWVDPLAVKRVVDLFRNLGGAERVVPAWAVRAIYAEGGATPAKFQTEGRNYRCSSFYYDFRAHRGVLLDAEVRLRLVSQAGDVTPLALRARKLRATGAGEMRAEDVTLFASEYYAPQVSLRVKRVHLVDPAVKEALANLDRVVLRGREDASGPGQAEIEEAVRALEAAAGRPAGVRLRLEGLSLRLFEVPLFGWPAVTWKGQETPVRWELDLGKRGQLNEGFRLGVGTDIGLGAQTLRWMVGAGYYDHRGPLVDLETELNPDGGRVRGKSFGVYLRDHGADFGIEPPTRDRYWTKHQYRWEIDPRWRLDGEYAGLSDSVWLRSYDEKEFKEGKEQETLLRLRRRDDRSYLTLTGKVRTIEFLDVLEELPRVAYSLPVVPLFAVGGTQVQLALAAELGNLRHRAGELATLPDFRTLRADVEPRVYADVDVGPIRVVPSASLRYTGYERTPASPGYESRLAGLVSLRADTQASRRYDGFLHLLNLSLELEDQFLVSVDATELFPLDDADRLTRYESIGIRARNRLQRPSADGLVTWFDLEVFAAWFPGGERPLGARGDGLVETDLEWTIGRRLELRARTSVELETGTLETASCETYWRLRPDLRAGVGLRHLEADSDILTSVVEFEVDTRWRLLAFSQYDFKTSDALDQGLLIQRLGQTVAVGVRVAYDPGDEDFSIGVKIDLLAAYKKERRREAAREEFRWR